MIVFSTLQNRLESWKRVQLTQRYSQVDARSKHFLTNQNAESTTHCSHADARSELSLIAAAT